MNEIVVKPGTEINLGKRGEHLARCVVFDISDWKKIYGEGRAHLLHQRNGDNAPYPCVVEMIDNKVLWTLNEVDLDVAGRGRAELQYFVGEARVKSETWFTRTDFAMNNEGPVPEEPAENWLDTMLELGTQTQDNAEAADDSAKAAQDSASAAAASAEAAKNSEEYTREIAEGVVAEAEQKILEHVTNAAASAESASEDSMSAKESAENAAASEEVAKEAEQAAKEAQEAAEKARDEASAIAGGDFATNAALKSHTDDVSNPHNVTKSQVGLGNVPNVATNNQTPTYTAATSLSALKSGEKLSVAFGKIAKAISDLISHLTNKSNPHGVTAAQVGAVPTTRKVNGKALSSDVTLGAADVGAIPVSGGIVSGNTPTSNPDPCYYPTADSTATRIRMYSGKGANYAGGAGLILTNKDASTNAGDFTLTAHDGTNASTLVGKPDGTLTWKGKNIYHEYNKPTAADVEAAPAADHNIKTYTSLGHIGLTASDMDAADAKANIIKIYNALPARSELWVHANTQSTNVNLGTSIASKLTADLGIGRLDYLELRFSRIGSTTMYLKVTPQLHSTTNFWHEKEFECVLRYTKGSVENLSPFLLRRSHKGFFDRAGDTIPGSVFGMLDGMVKLGAYTNMLQLSAYNTIGVSALSSHLQLLSGNNADKLNLVTYDKDGKRADYPVLHTGNVVASATDITAGSSASWQQYLVYE